MFVHTTHDQYQKVLTHCRGDQENYCFVMLQYYQVFASENQIE